jgi:hypothetical protein
LISAITKQKIEQEKKNNILSDICGKLKKLLGDNEAK